MSQNSVSVTYSRIATDIRRITWQFITAAVVWLILSGAALAQGTVPPIAKGCYYDSSGAPLASGVLLFQAAGTSTTSVIYSDSALATPTTNPAPLDSSGCTTSAIFLAAGSYKITLKNSSASQIWSVDNVPSYAHFGNVDLTGTAGETLAIREVVYLGAGGAWFKADSDLSTGSSTEAQAIGMTVAAAATGAQVTVRLVGRMTGLAGLVLGVPYYVSTTAGALDAIAPTRDRLVGYADSATSLILLGGQHKPAGAIASGTYDPVLSAGSNFDSLGTMVCMYLRVGTIVTVTCQATADATSAANATSEMTVPVPSNFAATTDAAGIGVATALGDSIYINASIANNTVVLNWLASTTSSTIIRFTFTYKIL